MKQLIKKILKEHVEDLEFLDSYHRRTKEIGDKILLELPRLGDNTTIKSTNGLGMIDYKNIGDWDVNLNEFKISKNLNALARKLEHMIRTGKADSIKRMLESICKNNIKTLYKPSGSYEQTKRNSLGKGHFRWDDTAITLSTEEIKRVCDYFNIK